MDKNSILRKIDIDLFLFPAVAVQDMHMIAFCRSEYAGHPVGCPNWNYKDGCPPHTKPFLTVYEPEVYVAIARLDFAKYLSLKRKLHKNWTDRALRNSRHWQGHLRAALEYYLTNVQIPAGYKPVLNAEAMGINIFETCARAGFHLERHPEHYVCNVKLLAKHL